MRLRSIARREAGCRTRGDEISPIVLASDDKSTLAHRRCFNEAFLHQAYSFLQFVCFHFDAAELQMDKCRTQPACLERSNGNLVNHALLLDFLAGALHRVQKAGNVGAPGGQLRVRGPRGGASAAQGKRDGPGRPVDASHQLLGNHHLRQPCLGLS